jgi:hypothetical protein
VIGNVSIPLGSDKPKRHSMPPPQVHYVINLVCTLYVIYVKKSTSGTLSVHVCKEDEIRVDLSLKSCKEKAKLGNDKKGKPARGPDPILGQLMAKSSLFHKWRYIHESTLQIRLFSAPLLQAF